MHITRAAVVVGLLMLSACGGDDDGPPPYVGGNGGNSGSGSAMDASFLDSGAIDASSDEDASVSVPSCIPSASDRFNETTVATDPSTFNLIGAPAGFGLAYEVDSCGNGISVMRFPSGGGEFLPQTVVNGSGSCSRAYDPALYFASGVWRLFYWDNRGGSNQLWSQTLDGDPAPQVEVETAMGGRSPLLGKIGATPFLGWVEQATPRPDWTALYVRPLDDLDATPRAVIAPSAAQHGFGFVFGGVEDVGAVGWVDTQSVDRGIFLQPLDTDGDSVGTPIKLATQASTRSSVDLADGAMNAAVVYSTVTDNVAFEVRFRQLDETATPFGIEERIVSRAERGTDGSIAPIGNGYVVAFRALPEVSDGTAIVKLFLIDKTGRRLAEPANIANTTADGGRVTVRSSFDGRFTVSWVEADGDGQRVRMVRVPCR